MLCILIDIALKFYAVPSRPTWVTLRSRSVLEILCESFWLKFLCCKPISFEYVDGSS